MYYSSLVHVHLMFKQISATERRKGRGEGGGRDEEASL